MRVALAAVLFSEPDLLLLDEPTAHLDPGAEAAFLHTLVALAPGRTILIVTHREAPGRIAHRRLRIDDGGLHEDLSLPRGASERESQAEAS